MKRSNTLDKIIFIFIVTFLLYLVGAFAGMSFNPNNWLLFNRDNNAAIARGFVLAIWIAFILILSFNRFKF